MPTVGHLKGVASWKKSVFHLKGDASLKQDNTKKGAWVAARLDGRGLAMEEPMQAAAAEHLGLAQVARGVAGRVDAVVVHLQSFKRHIIIASPAMLTG